MTALLTAEALTVKSRRATLIADVSLELRAGRLAVLVGPNGAGKSTLLRTLSGEQVPHAGRVVLDGEALGAIPPWRLACMRAVLPQGIAVALPFTAREIVRLGCDGIGRRTSRAARDALVEATLAQAEALPFADRVIQTLSGGEQQRVHFARVLCQLNAGRAVAKRQLLLLDEPIASLDLKHQIALLDRLVDLAQDGVAVLVIIHDLNLAAAFADDLIVLDRGRIVGQGAPAAVMTDALLAETFGLDLAVRTVPDAPTPFVLPRSRRAEGHA